MAKPRIRAILSIDLGPQTKDRLTKLATRRGLGPSSLAAQIIREYLNEHDPATATVVPGTKPPQSVSPAWEAVVRMTENEPDFSGAPEKSSDCSRRSSHRLSLDPGSLTLLRLHGEALGLSPNRTLHYLLRAALGSLPLMSGPELQEINEASYVLSRLAINLNELAHHANKLALDQFDREKEMRLLQAVRETLTHIEQFVSNYTELLDSLVDIARDRWRRASDELPQPEFSIVTEHQSA